MTGSGAKERVGLQMTREYFLIWIDILGFDLLPKEIHEEKGVEERKVRTDFIGILRERIDSIEAKGLILGKNYGEKDDWLLVADSMNKAFRVIAEILEHNTGYEEYEKIPLEIGVGVGEYDRWVKFSGAELVVETSTIDALKTKVIGNYHKWYEKINKKRIESTFVVLTESAFDRLEPLDKEMCCRIEHRDRGKKGSRLIFFHASVAGIQRRGKVFDFLERIEHSGSKWYDRIDNVFVPPTKYKDMIKTLEEDKIVFIVGTPEYGKTYTAVRLLWDYFCKNYDPIWIKGGEPSQRMRARERLEEIESELRPPCVIYFEDPFGLSAYEGRNSLERKIGTIIECIGTAKNCKVIVTSREEVFKQFKKEHSSFVELEKFEKRLSIERNSYDQGKRKKILRSWAEAKGCKWLKDDRLRKTVEESLDEGMLATPLSIRDFVVSTINVTKIDELRSIENFRNLPRYVRDQFVVLSRRGDVAKSVAHALAACFEELPENIRSLLGELATKDSSIAKNVAFAVARYFDSLPESARDLLVVLAKRNDTAWSVAFAVAKHFHRLPEGIRNLLVELAKRDTAVAKGVVRAVSQYSERIPEGFRDSIYNALKPPLRWRSTKTFNNLKHCK